MASTMMNVTVARPMAAQLSSRNATCAPLVARTAAPGMARLATLVIAAKNGGSVEKAMAAVRDVKVNDSAKAVLAATVSNVLLAAPANAGVLFDFNLTLPIIAGQFLLLMFILDKLIYTPVGEVIDKRDNELREKITAVKDNSGELAALAAEAEGYLSAARSEATEAINAAKKKTEAECADKVASAKNKMDGELATAVNQLMAQKEDSLKNLDDAVEKLSDQIVSKVLPA
jgi:F-type H+-transporting ATPase subunit b